MPLRWNSLICIEGKAGWKRLFCHRFAANFTGTHLSSEKCAAFFRKKKKTIWRKKRTSYMSKPVDERRETNRCLGELMHSIVLSTIWWLFTFCNKLVYLCHSDLEVKWALIRYGVFTPWNYLSARKFEMIIQLSIETCSEKCVVRQCSEGKSGVS